MWSEDIVVCVLCETVVSLLVHRVSLCGVRTYTSGLSGWSVVTL